MQENFNKDKLVTMQKLTKKEHKGVYVFLDIS